MEVPPGYRDEVLMWERLPVPTPATKRGLASTRGTASGLGGMGKPVPIKTLSGGIGSSWDHTQWPWTLKRTALASGHTITYAVRATMRWCHHAVVRPFDGATGVSSIQWQSLSRLVDPPASA